MIMSHVEQSNMIPRDEFGSLFFGALVVSQPYSIVPHRHALNLVIQREFDERASIDNHNFHPLVLPCGTKLIASKAALLFSG